MSPTTASNLSDQEIIHFVTPIPLRYLGSQGTSCAEPYCIASVALVSYDTVPYISCCGVLTFGKMRLGDHTDEALALSHSFEWYRGCPSSA